MRLAVDFDQLRQELSDSIVEGPQERYRLDWPGKREALLTANTPIDKTLRPCREESVDFDTTQNLFIEGDNLDALKLLQETYLGKVKMIYIDPPYNTGKDFIYRDNFAADKQHYLEDSGQIDEQGGRLISNLDSNGRYHSDWLSMMYPRLKLARNLLRDDGVIFISIDDNEVASLRKVCDEIFGEANFVGNIGWESKTKTQNTKDSFNKLQPKIEYILCYAKSSKMRFNLVLIDEKKYPEKDKNGKFRYTLIEQMSALGIRSRDSMVFPILGINPQHNNQWKIGIKKVEKFQERGDLLKKEGNPYLKTRPNDERTEITKPFWAFFSKEKGTAENAKRELSDILESRLHGFETVKPVGIIKQILFHATSHGSIVLDFFAGSATTAHATMQLNAEDGGNRQFIMVQLPEQTDEKSEAFKAGYKTIAEISKERIRRAGKKILEGECHKDWNKDVGFRVLKIDTSNMADVYYTPEKTKQGELLAAVDNIKTGRDNPEDMLFQVLIDWGVDLTLPIQRKTIQGKTVFSVNHEPYDLIACFDKGITEQLVRELATHKPVRVVFRDNGFVSDAVKINAEQIFRQLSPATDVKSI